VPDRYLESTEQWRGLALEAPSPLVREIEPLDAKTQLAERLLLGLRLAEGVDLGAAGRELGVNPWTPDRRTVVERLLDAGQLVRYGNRLRIPEKHWLFADAIIRDLL
jgi:oxygen-independent coproporphyrinogen-3 oxidase